MLLYTKYYVCELNLTKSRTELVVGTPGSIIKNFVFNFEILVDSQAALRNYTVKSCMPSPFSVSGTSCGTTISHQEIDIGTIHRPFSDFTSFTCTHLHVYMCILNSKHQISCVGSCDHHPSQVSEQSISLLFPWIATAPLLSLPGSLTPSNVDQ